MADPNSIIGLLAQEYSSETRLYELVLHQNDALTSGSDSSPLGASGLLVEGFVGTEALHKFSTHDIIALSTNARIDLFSLLGQTASLEISLSNATRTRYTGIITEAAQIGSEGGLARYQLKLSSWLWLLTQQTRSRVWQEQSVMQIIDSILAGYPQYAAWQWSDDVMPFMASARNRSYCVQYRETDYAFISRLLAEEGLSFRVEEAAAHPETESNAPAHHRMVIFAETTQASSIPEDLSSTSHLGGRGIRFHGGRSREEQDAIQYLSFKRSLNPAQTTVATYDYKSKRIIAASAPTNHTYGGQNAPALESFDASGAYTYASSAEATRYANLHQQAFEARNKIWQAKSTVRTLRPGTRFALTQSPVSAGDTYAGDATAPEYLVLTVRSIGINNLPKPALEAISEMMGDVSTLLKQSIQKMHKGDYHDTETHYAESGGTRDDPAWVLRPSRPTQNKNAIYQGVDHAAIYQQFVQRFSPEHQANLAQQASTADTLNANLEHAKTLGYANAFEAIRIDIPWRSVLEDGTGTLHNPKPTAPGSQTAIVVGPDGLDNPSDHSYGQDELYCDRLGRVKIRFHWQNAYASQTSSNNSTATCWVRVAQRSAAAGMGWQFLPRIGQEVLVQFIEGDIDRPIIIAALYNGQGEGGIQPTTAGAPQRTATDTHRQVFDHAHDHSPSAQGNLVGGNSPVWHGFAADKHHNAAAITGIRTKEFGGYGYNQLALDDSDEQGRIQLKTTQAATELGLGHLIHTADNYRGSFRGQGAELRTDAYGALRAGAGYLITSYAARYTPQQRDASADNVAGTAHLKQAVQLMSTFNQASKHHQTVQYSTHIGSHQSKASSIASGSQTTEPPIQALHTAARGMVSAAHLQQAETDAQNKHTRPEANTLPHSTDPVLSLVGKAGLSMVAGQHLQLANQETSTLISGQDSQFITGEQNRLHTGQAIGMLAGAVGAGKNNIGLQFITAQDNTHIQAQSDEIKVQAKNTINVMSSHSHIDWAAAKSISITTADGASITLEGGGIKVQCPGKITVHAAKKVFTKASKVKYELPQMPRGEFCLECLLKTLQSGSGLARV